MPAPAEPPGGNPLPTPQEVRTWSSSHLVDYLDPVFTSFSNDSIRTAFRNAFIDGTCFLEVFGDPDIYAEFNIPRAPGWRLAKEANDILGKTTPRLQPKRTYLLNRRPRLQLLKCLSDTMDRKARIGRAGGECAISEAARADGGPGGY